MTKIYFIPSVILIFIFNCCLAQNTKPDPVTITKYRTETGEQLSIESGILSEKKEIYIGLPDTYNDSTKYPVVVVLEGEVLFETFAPLTNLMGQVNEIPECIVVGIPFYNKHLEYAPKITGHPESGNADKMLEFYREELFPILDSLYHCTEDRIIWAHSGLGGIFCTYLLLGPDSQFSGILSSSPNLKWIQEYITAESAFQLLSKKGRVFYYLTFGSNEGEAYMGNMYQQVNEFRDKLAAEAPGNLVWKFQLYENNNHFTNAIETYMDGLILYFKLMKQD
jgi:predicted alpha/beta superfamily hydrolase